MHSSIEVMLLLIVMVVRLLHAQNAPAPIEVTLSGIMMLVRLQLWNALSPIEVRLLQIVTVVRLLQYQNALLPIVFKVFGSLTEVNEVF